PALAAAAKARGDDSRVEPTSCSGFCARGPIVVSRPDGTIFADVTADQATSLVGGGPAPAGTLPATALPPDLPFFARQTRVVMANAGAIDPLRLESYVGAGGYEVLGMVLNDLTPQQVVDEIVASGLRGRGDAGFPTGVKWSLVARTIADQKYVICNGDEGDPSAFMNRAVIKGDPHRVLEGMANAGYAIGATQSYVYVREKYPLAVERLAAAIHQAEHRGILSARILDSAFQFRVDLRIGADAFVCGE